MGDAGVQPSYQVPMAAANSLIALSRYEPQTSVEDLSPSTCIGPPPTRSVVGTKLDCVSLVGVEIFGRGSIAAVLETFEGEPVIGAEILWTGDAYFGDVKPDVSSTDDTGRTL